MRTSTQQTLHALSSSTSIVASLILVCVLLGPNAASIADAPEPVAGEAMSAVVTEALPSTSDQVAGPGIAADELRIEDLVDLDAPVPDLEKEEETVEVEFGRMDGY